MFLLVFLIMCRFVHVSCVQNTLAPSISGAEQVGERNRAEREKVKKNEMRKNTVRTNTVDLLVMVEM